MSIFDRRKPIEVPKSFESRADAFNYMLRYQLEEKKEEPLDAAKKANEFAEIFATNMGIPLIVEPEKIGIDKYLAMADKLASWIERNPKVVEYGVPAITGLAGLLVGKKIEQAEDKHENVVHEEIDFDKIQ